MSEIKDLDGLPAGEITLMVANSERKTVDLLEQKFTEHRELIETRLDKQDTKLASMERDLSALVGSGAIPGLITQIKETLDKSLDRQTTQMNAQAKWHEESLDYRTLAEQSRLDIAERMGKVETQVKSIRGLVYSFRLIARGARGCVGLIQKVELWKLGGVGVLLLTLNKVSPKLFALLLHILHTR